MGTFQLKITLIDIKTVSDGVFKGKFSLDVGNVDVKNATFAFRVNVADSLFVVYKKRKVFAKEANGKILAGKDIGSQVVLFLFKMALDIWRGRINTSEYALAVKKMGPVMLIETPTPDNLEPALVKVCADND